MKHVKEANDRTLTKERWTIERRHEWPIDRSTDRQAISQTDNEKLIIINRRQTDKQTGPDKQKDRHDTKPTMTEWLIDRSTDRQSAWRTDRQTDRKIDRQTNRQTQNERTNGEWVIDRYRSLYWQTISVTDRQTDRQRDRQNEPKPTKQTNERISLVQQTTKRTNTALNFFTFRFQHEKLFAINQLETTDKTSSSWRWNKTAELGWHQIFRKLILIKCLSVLPEVTVSFHMNKESWDPIGT